MITDVAELKAHFKVTSDKDDHVFYAMLLAAQAIAEKYCDTKIEAQDITEYQDGGGSNYLLTKNFPLNSVASIHDDIDRVYGADSLIDAEDYTIDASGMIQFDAIILLEGNKNVKIVYNAGYTEELMPYDIKLAIWNLAFAPYLEAAGGVNAIVAEDFVYRPAKLRTDAFTTLDRYKKIR